jgi:hypothetical protein
MQDFIALKAVDLVDVCVRLDWGAIEFLKIY